MNNFIKVYSNAFKDEWCDSLIKDWNNFSKPPENEPDYRYKMNVTQIRNDSIITLDKSFETDTNESTLLKKKYHKKTVDTVIKYASMYNSNEVGMILPPLEIVGAQLQKTESECSGGYYEFHYEQTGYENNPDPMRRMLVWMLYLNDIPKGEGETEFLYQKLRVQPKRGDLVIWPAMFTHTHRGNPVYTKDKFILTGWLSWPEHKFGVGL